ncbi:MAG: hypothetical protein D6788_08005, partial [Planctomycetota bacterium]
MNMATRWVCAVGMMIGPCAGVVFGQSQGKASTAQVVDLSESVQRVTVPLHGSITVATRAEIVRADVIAQDVADVQVLSPKRILITGRAYGTTSVVLLGADKSQSVFEVSVELDLRRLNETIRKIDPQSEAKAISVRGSILLTGRVSSAERAKRIAELAALFLPSSGTQQQTFTVQNHLDVAGEQQVLVRCIVAEMNRQAARELGING